MMLERWRGGGDMMMLERLRGIQLSGEGSYGGSYERDNGEGSKAMRGIQGEGYNNANIPPQT